MIVLMFRDTKCYFVLIYVGKEMNISSSHLIAGLCWMSDKR